ncbi:MAG: hypothetical protein AMJ93_10090 [Anaerolineae bacterium SM23_84]|nr:MAG: hypothetical protein AMJ93_10090 [Anaerolineae bacterium SM23_84]
MTRLGRNDPCPCGSGKKYKNCCLHKDRAQRIRERAWRREEQVTLEKLFAFAQQPNFSSQLTVAFNLFWNGNYGAEGWNALDSDEIGRFLDWYVHDYRLDRTRERIIDLFIKEMGARLLPGELERVKSWSGSQINVYRITEAAEPGLLSVVGVFQKIGETVGDDGLGQLSMPGDLALGRILRSSEPPHFSWAAILLPAQMEAELVSFVEGAYEQYQATHIDTSWPGFLSDSGYLFNHYLLRSAAEKGEALPPGRAYYDASRTVQTLREVERRLREQAVRAAEERQTEEERLKEEKEGTPLRRTQGGVLLPGYVHYKDDEESKQ